MTDARLTAVATEGGVTDDLRSCHTAKVDGYTVEGHVPAADVQKMLKERPKISGIAVPGMPMGSPGMEQGGPKDPYDTVAFTKAGAKTVYVRTAERQSVPRVPIGRASLRGAVGAGAAVLAQEVRVVRWYSVAWRQSASLARNCPTSRAQAPAQAGASVSPSTQPRNAANARR